MTMNVSVTYNFFLHEWAPPGGRLWLWLQPCLPFNSVGDYIDALAQPNALTFELIKPPAQDCETADLVPVPFPADLDISLVSDLATRATVARRTRLVVRDANELLKENNPPQPLLDHRAGDQAQWVDKNKDQPSPELFLPNKGETFAAAYQRLLRDALSAKHGAVSLSSLANFLRLGLWLGSRWDVSNTSIESLASDALDDGFMRLPGPPDLVRTNLHSLLGHLISVGTPPTIEKLKDVKSFAVKLTDKVGRTTTIDLVPEVAQLDLLRKYFEGAGKVDTNPGRVIEAQRDLDPNAAAGGALDLDSRIYLRPRTVALGRRLLGGALSGKVAFCHTRSVRGREQTADVTIERIRGLVVAPEEAPAVASGNLEFSLADTYDVRFVTYGRSSGAGYRTNRPAPSDEWSLVEVKPGPDDAEAFASEELSPPAGGGMPPGMSIIDGNGAELLCEFVGWVRLPKDDRKVLLLAVPTSNLRAPDPRGLVVFARAPRLRAAWIAGTDQVPGHWSWEGDFTSDPSAARKFDTLILEDGTIPDRMPEKADVGFGLRLSGEADYEFARSISRVEGALGVTLAKPAENDAAQGDVDSDSRNFAALNVYVTDGAGDGEPPVYNRWHLNERSELYPLIRKCGAVDSQWYSYRYGMPGRHYPAEAATVRQYLKALYGERRRRDVHLTVEHSLGAEYRLPDGSPVSCRLDFPVALATDAGDAKAQRTDSKAGSFLSVEYLGASSGTLGKAVISINTAWLAERPMRSEPGAWARFTTAWAAVAELASCAEAELTLQQYGFELSKALGEKSRAAAGWTLLHQTNVGMPELEKIVEACRSWLRGDALPAAGRHTAEVPLSAVPRKGDLGALVLKVSRAPEIAPGNSESFVLVRSRETKSVSRGDFVDHRPGETMLVPKEDPDSSGLRRWLEGMRSRCAPIAATGDSCRDGTNVVSRVGAAFKDVEEGVLFLLGPPRNAEPDRKLAVALCPLAFRPVANDPYLGPATLRVVRSYFIALDDYLSMGIPDTLPTDPAAWAGRIREIEARGAEILSLIDLASSLLMPAYLANDAENGPLGELLRGLSAVTPSRDGLRDVIQAHVRRRMELSPSAFANAKAFSFTQVTPAKPGALPRDLVELRSSRNTAERPGQEASVDDGRARLEDVPLGVAGSTSSIGYVEYLDDARYSNAYTLVPKAGDTLPLQLIPSGKIIEELSQLGSTASPLPLEDDAVLLPDARQKAGQASVRIRLPSREPIVDPVFVWSGAIETGGLPLHDAVTKLSGKLSRSALMEGTLRATQVPADQLELVAGASNGVQEKGLDTTLVAAVYLLRSDEEGNLDNDCLYVRGTTGIVAKNADAAASPDLLALFLELLERRSGGSLRDPKRLVVPETIAYMRTMLARKPMDNKSIGSEPAGPFFSVDGKVLKEHEALPERPLTAFVLGAPSPSDSDSRTLLFLVCGCFPIWAPARLALLQTRNERGSRKLRRFAPDFHGVSREVGADPRSPSKASPSWRKAPVQLPRSCTVADLVKPWGELDPLWRTARLSVTVFELARIGLPAQAIEEPPGDPGVEVIHRDRFPVNLREFAARAVDAAGDPRDVSELWFPEPWNRFIVDLQWFSSSNHQLLRLEGMEVVVAP